MGRLESVQNMQFIMSVPKWLLQGRLSSGSLLAKYAKECWGGGRGRHPTALYEQGNIGVRYSISCFGLPELLPVPEDWGGGQV